MPIKKSLKKHLNDLYKDQADEVFNEILEKISDFNPHQSLTRERRHMNEQDLLLISYPHQIINLESQSESPLHTLADFFNAQLSEAFSGVHILPFYPSSSDGGFAVSSYEEVDPEFGDWDDLKRFKGDLMFDAVFNHTSSQHDWFQSWIKGDPQYEDYYHFFDHKPEEGSPVYEQLKKVTRPRSSELLVEFQKENKNVYVWATFSEDQLDVNFHNPKVLLEFVDLLLLYIKNGATFLRIDAVPFLWKEVGTDCSHRPQTHSLIKVFRAVLDLVHPEAQLVTESNVPHKENISYLGSGVDEAQMIYNFSLAPLILDSLLNESSANLKTWVDNLDPLFPDNCFFNFTATHDGIGVRPLEGILSDEEISHLVEKLKDKGGMVSYRSIAGVLKPYEVNITWASALDHADKQWTLNRILSSYAMSCVFPGVPGFYFHNLVGSPNWIEGYKASEHRRDVNRKMLSLTELNQMCENPFHGEIFKRTLELLKERRHHKVFHPQASFDQLESPDYLWVVDREYEGEKGRFIFNLSSNKVNLSPYAKGQLDPFDFLWLLKEDKD